ncbi:hypothetical protein Cgig2_005256 [Carnegiea gigantea]|uniref:Uncharacterized protein n=1 Tax=Carnegiea gigantea TaxID=171969 RepID=A0A9Q1QBT2_9CARY|nr:hypothetical protein Cgig2_005256 [Carnegiea gigantea]
MASKCSRFINRTSLSCLKSSIKSASTSAPRPSAPPLRSASSSLPRFSFSRIRRRSVVDAVAQRGSDGEDDFMPKHDVEELSSSFTGYTLLHLSRPLKIAWPRRTQVTVSRLSLRQEAVFVWLEKPVMQFCCIRSRLLLLLISAPFSVSSLRL